MITLNLNGKSLLAFFLLLLLLAESHELAHIFTGYAFCGCWGERDFNVWGLCAGCRDENPWAIAATFAGPIFTFSLIWLGRHWLKGQNARKQILGFVLIFANLPFARIFTALMGGGDEVYGLNVLLGNEGNWPIIWSVGLLIVLALAIPPLLTAWKAIANPRKWAYFLGFLILPMIVAMVVIFIGLNGLLAKGVLATPLIWGTPVLISIHTVIVAVLVGLSFPYLFQLRKNEETI